MSINILAIETSCDETSASVVADGKNVLSNVIYTQIATHKAYGGVVPEIASREHLRKISVVVKRAVEESGIGLKDLNAVAVTKGPGLIGSVLVGLSYGKSVAEALDIPLIGVHHLAGHLYAGIMSSDIMEPPLVALITSGGHSSVVYMSEHLSFELMGETRDDAAGEVLDKVARKLGLPYPGGAALEKLASKGNSQAYQFPRVMLEHDSYDFSFSGLKSHVINTLNRADMKGEEVCREDIAASFQAAMFEVLTAKAVKACLEKGVDKLILCGGVAANGCLRRMLEAEAAKHDIAFHYPPAVLCTDNAAMIGAVAYQKYLRNEFNCISLNATANLSLENE